MPCMLGRSQRHFFKKGHCHGQQNNYGSRSQAHSRSYSLARYLAAQPRPWPKSESGTRYRHAQQKEPRQALQKRRLIPHRDAMVLGRPLRHVNGSPSPHHRPRICQPLRCALAPLVSQQLQKRPVRQHFGFASLQTFQIVGINHVKALAMQTPLHAPPAG